MSVPTLQDVLANSVPSKSPYNRDAFIKYLASIHCIENYEFIHDVNKYYKLSKEKDKIVKWASIIKLYLLEDSSKEINLPYQYKKNLLVKIPNADALKKSYKIIFELLLDSYNLFINIIKKQSMSSYGSLPIPAPRRNSSSVGSERRNSASTGSRRNSVIEMHSSRRNSSLSNLPTGTVFMSRSNSVSLPTSHGSRRPSATIDYPKSPVNNGTGTAKIVKLPSPLSDVEMKQKKTLSKDQSKDSLFKMKKFKFRRNSND